MDHLRLHFAVSIVCSIGGSFFLEVTLVSPDLIQSIHFLLSYWTFFIVSPRWHCFPRKKKPLLSNSFQVYTEIDLGSTNGQRTLMRSRSELGMRRGSTCVEPIALPSFRFRNAREFHFECFRYESSCRIFSSSCQGKKSCMLPDAEPRSMTPPPTKLGLNQRKWQIKDELRAIPCRRLRAEAQNRGSSLKLCIFRYNTLFLTRVEFGKYVSTPRRSNLNTSPCVTSA